MLAAKVESVRLTICQPTLGSTVDTAAPPEADLLGFSQCVITVMLCHKLLQIQWLKIRSIILTVMGSEIYSGLCFMAL